MATEKDFKIKNGLILNNDNSGARVTRSGNYLKNTTQYGYIQFGPNNTGFAHIDTDRTQFYFSKKIIVDEGVVSSYNEDLVLKRASGTTNQLTIGTSAATFAGNLVVTGNLTVNGTTVTNSSTNTTIEDSLIELNSGAGSNSNDLGLILERGSTGDNVFIGWDESEDKIAFGTTTATGSSTGNISYSRASILANALDLTNHIDMADNARIRLGNSDDLQLFHDGSSSIIRNDTGHLDIKNGTNDADIRFMCDDGSGGEITYFLLDGSNAKTQFNRHLKIIDDMQIQVGTGPDMLLYHDGTDSYIDNNTGDLYIRGQGDDLILRANDDIHIQPQGNDNGISLIGNGGVLIYYDSSQKLATTSAGVEVSGSLLINEGNAFTDFNVKSDRTSGNIGGMNFVNASGVVKGQVYGDVDGNVLFASGGSTTAFLIDSSQRAGFGTSSPEEKIEVNGNIRMQSTISTTTARPAATVATLTNGEIRAKNADGSDGGLLRLSAGAGTTQNTMSYIDLQGYSTAETNNGKHIIFGTGGADRMEITESGNVGIGTATPSEKLSVAPDTDISAEIGRAHIGSVGHSDYAGFSHVDKNTTGNFALMQHGSGVTYLNASSGTAINFRINNSQVMQMTSTGLGIGTTSPAAALDVNGEIHMTTVLVHKGDTDTTAGFHGNDLFRVVTGGTERFEVSNSGIIINDGSADYDFRVESNGDSNMLFVDGGNDKVGIGTGTPAETLDVDGTMKVGNMKFQNAAGGRLGFNRNTGTGAIYNNSYGAYQFQNNQSGYFEIQVYDSSGSHVTAHTYTTDGKVGLGTTSPTNRLSVSGNLNTTGGATIGDSSSDSLVFTGLLKQGLSGGTTVMDASRNMSNIGTISSGAITSTGTSLFETANSQHTGSTVNETLWEITDWDTTESLRQKLNTTSTNFTKVDDDTAPAGGVFQVVSNNNVYPNKFYPISDETYIIFEAWVKHESGSDTSGNFYAGSTFYNGSQVSFGNVNRYWGAGGDAQDSDNTTWRHIRGVLNGEALRNTTGTIDAEYMKLLFLFNYNASGNTSRYCGVRFYHSRKAVTHLLHVTSSQGDRGFRDTYDDDSSAKVILDGSRNIINAETLSIGQASNTLSAKLEALGTDARLQVHYSGQSRGGIGAFSSQRVGMYSTSSNDDLIFGTTTTGASANFVTRMYINNGDGNVGIGTTSPIYDLQIGSYGTDSDSTLALASTTSGTGSIRFGDGTSGAEANAGKIAYDHSNNSMQFFTNDGTERVRITSAGNVGIGITNPSFKLVVSNGGASGIEFGPAYSGTANLIQSYNRSGTAYVNTVYDADTHRFNISGSEKVRIDSSGNLGIGTTSPSGNLHISGGSSKFRLTDTGITDANNNTLIAYAAAQNKFALGVSSTTGTSADIVIDGANNRVGIGTTSPDNVLHVKHASDNVVAKFESGDNQVWINLNDDGGGTYGCLIGHDSDAGDLFTIADNGVNKRIRVAENGNVCIGSTSPAFTSGSGLEIERGGTTTLRLQNTASSKTVEFNMGTDLEIKCLNTGSDIILTPTANVGIGYTAPSNKLSVNGVITSGNFTAAGIGGTPGDANTAELGPGYLNLARDDTATAKQIVFGKNGAVHSYIETSASSLNIRSDTVIQFLTAAGGSAQNIRTMSVFAGSTYGDIPPNGSVNATNTYELNGTTVIDSSRNLTNIGSISATEFTGHIEAGGHLDFNIGINHGTTGDAATWWISQHSTGQSDVPGNYYDIINLSSATTHGVQIASNYGATSGQIYMRTRSDNNNAPSGGSGLQAWNKLWHNNNDGSGSGLDADTVDGIQASEFLRSNTADSASGTLTFSGVQKYLGATFWQVSSSDTAVQRADARDDDTDKARLHWYGVTASDGTSNFRHAWYDGNSYVAVTAENDGASFGGHLNISSGYDYKINTTTVINSSRQLVNIDTITITGQASGGSVLKLENNSWVAVKDNGGTHRRTMGSSANQLFVGDIDASFTNAYFRGGSSNTYIQHNNSTKIEINSSTTQITNDLLPSSNDTYDLGSTANAWKELHVEDIRFHNASGAVGGIGQYNTGGDIEILSDHNIVFKETDAGTIKAVFGMNGPNFTFGQTTENTSYRVYVNGSIASTADVTAYASDERLKTNIVEIGSAIEKVKQLRGVTFDWQDDVEEKGFEPAAKHETGVIAQEVQKVIPDAVVPAPFDPEYWTVKHEKIIPVLIEAIKEQQKEIEQLKKHSHPAKDMCDMNGYEELVARIEKMEKNYGNN